jgi:hypothetical protein
LESSQKITLQDMYAMLKYKREIKLEVMINIEAEPDLKMLCGNFVQEQNSRRSNNSSAGVVKLESCFKAFSTEELLSGNDQWYCNKCKEHRDIHKKLELYKVPRILII